MDLGSGVVKNLTTGETLEGTPLPEFVLRILDEGGLIPYLRARAEEDAST